MLVPAVPAAVAAVAAAAFVAVGVPFQCVGNTLACLVDVDAENAKF